MKGLGPELLGSPLGHGETSFSISSSLTYPLSPYFYVCPIPRTGFSVSFLRVLRPDKEFGVAPRTDETGRVGTTGLPGSRGSLRERSSSVGSHRIRHLPSYEGRVTGDTGS